MSSKRLSSIETRKGMLSQREADLYVKSVLSFREDDLSNLSDTYSFNKHDRHIEHDVIELAKKGAFV